MVAGKLDTTDAPMLANALRRWHDEGLWAAWRQYRNGMTE